MVTISSIATLNGPSSTPAPATNGDNADFTLALAGASNAATPSTGPSSDVSDGAPTPSGADDEAATGLQDPADQGKDLPDDKDDADDAAQLSVLAWLGTTITLPTAAPDPSVQPGAQSTAASAAQAVGDRSGAGPLLVSTLTATVPDTEAAATDNDSASTTPTGTGTDTKRATDAIDPDSVAKAAAADTRAVTPKAVAATAQDINAATTGQPNPPPAANTTSNPAAAPAQLAIAQLVQSIVPGQIRSSIVASPIAIAARDARRGTDTAASDTPAIGDIPLTSPALVIGDILPAGRAFAAAIVAATPAAKRGQRDVIDTITAPTAQIGGDIDAQALASAGTSAIDTRHEQWVSALADHIEALRDAADARDTRIRLVPDALGKIDVALSREGDALHVRFSAEQPAARQLLVDAQPRLADIAAARGLRIGQTSVDGGSGSGAGWGSANGGGTRQQETASRQPIANRFMVNADEQPAADQAIASGWIA